MTHATTYPIHYASLQVECADRVAWVWLHRPEVRNAFDETMIAEVTDVFGRLGMDSEVRAIVLAATGKAFCAGADLNMMKRLAEASLEQNQADGLRMAGMLRTLHDCPKPIIARIQGDCYAGGVGLAAICDVSVAAHEAKFCLSEVRIGLTPATISPYVIKAIGEKAARRYMVTAERFDANEAQRIGLIDSVTAMDELDVVIEALLAQLKRNSPNAMHAAKRLVADMAGQPVTDRLVLETAQRIAVMRASEEGKEGLQSFLQKRKPNWVAED